MASRNPTAADALCYPFVRVWSEVDRVAPAVTHHPRITFAAAATAAFSGLSYYNRWGFRLGLLMKISSLWNVQLKGLLRGAGPAAVLRCLSSSQCLELTSLGKHNGAPVACLSCKS